MAAEPDATIADLELLETYLDNEFDAAETAAIVHRLGTDAPLAAALADLRRQRELRAAVWKALEPDARSAEQLVWRVRGAAAEHRQASSVEEPASAVAIHASNRSPWSAWNLARWPAAAACIIIGFAIGRFAHSANQGAGVRSAPSAQMPLAENSDVSLPAPAPGTYTSYSYPFQASPDTRRFDDDFASHGPALPTAAPAGFNDDRVKLSSDEKVEQKF